MRQKQRRFWSRFGLPLLALSLACVCAWLAVLATKRGWWEPGEVALNLFVALAGLAFTIIVLDRLFVLRSSAQYIDRLLTQLRSGDGALAAWALRQLDAAGCLRDGSLRDADLEGANLDGADLSHVDLGGADMENASLRGANLFEANFSGALLAGADLSGANMTKACLHRTRLWVADDSSQGPIERALYYEWRAVSKALEENPSLTLLAAKFDGQTILPDGSAWACHSDLDRHTGNGLWISYQPGVIHKYVDATYEIRGPAGNKLFETEKMLEEYVRKTYGGTDVVGD